MICRWNNNGNSDDVFSGESKGTKEGDDGGVESVADEGAIHQPKQPRHRRNDGLGTFDMPKNVLKQLKSKENAFFVDAVV